METFYTLQDLMTQTKGMTYVLLGVFLVCILAFWHYLTGRDGENEFK
jgi:hypothetical protein